MGGTTGGGGGGTTGDGDGAGNGGPLNGGAGGSSGVAGSDAAGPGGGGGGGGDEAAGGAGGFGGGGGGSGENDAGPIQPGGAGGFGGGGGGGGEDQSGGAGGFGGGGGGGSTDSDAQGESSVGGFGGGNGGGAGAGPVTDSAGAGGGAGLGGAIFNLAGDVTLSNSTLSANTAQGGTGGTSVTAPPGEPGHGLGGGLFNLNGVVTLEHSTFASNTAELGADAFALGHPAAGSVPAGAAQLALEDSIFDTALTGNLAVEAFQVAASEAEITTADGASFTRNTVDNAGGVLDASGLTVADAELGPLTDNGGPTATHAPAYPGSPAVDAAADGPATDQRGEARPQGEAFDSGAVEVPQFCGDGTLQLGEACDDGNTEDGDGCSAACALDCNAGPLASCVAAGAGSLSIDEGKPGKEKAKAKLEKFASAVVASDFGDPVAGDTSMRVCVYDDADALALELNVDRAGDLCGPKQKPCWKPIEGKGFAYKDPSAQASGVSELKAKGGKAGKGSVTVKGKNDPKKGLTSLPTGGAAALAGSTQAAIQLVTSDAGCFEVQLPRVKKADGTRFEAKAP